jgi:phosphopantothenoylcysteine decarboxylase/phosphopantothenate--cysteine ligase
MRDRKASAQPDSAGEYLSSIRRLLIVAGGSIAAASLPQFIQWFYMLLPQLEIKVALTRNAATLVQPAAISALTRNQVFHDLHPGENGAIPHIDLTDWADLLLIMPATANIIGKAAQGIADDLATTLILAADIPVVFVPCMNQRMWQRPAVQRNVTQLREDGAWVIDPEEGIQASTGTVATGSMPSLKKILNELINIMVLEHREETELA